MLTNRFKQVLSIAIAVCGLSLTGCGSSLTGCGSSLTGCGYSLTGSAGNPLIWHVNAADPSAHVWPGDDRLWLYTSHDQPGTNTHDTMISYHVFSTTDLVNWIDYGCVLHLKDVSWAASHAWAIDAVKWKGLYYLVFCMQEKETGIFRTGLATSKLPQGPFTDIGFIKGVDWGQDPALFVDDDGKPYLFWGCGGGCFGAQLSEDLLSVVPGTIVDLKKQLKWVFEGPWVHKYKGKYYLSYPGLFENKWPEHMYYAIADKPLGPYVFKGEYIGVFDKMAGTNHGSIIEYKGKWYSFYHSAWVSGGKSECRNLMADELFYNEDGTIKLIIPSIEGAAIEGVKPASSKCVILLEAENAEGRPTYGTFLSVKTASERKGFSGSGYVTGFDKKNYYAEVMVQIAKNCKARLKVGYAADKDQVNKVLVNYTVINDIAFPKSKTFTEVDLGTVNLREGDNFIRLTYIDGGIDLDYFKLEPIAD